MTWSIKYGLKQKGSGLKAFTIFLIIWFCFWGLLVGIPAINDAVKGNESIGLMIAVQIIAQVFFVGPFYIIQVIWVHVYKKRVIREQEQEKIQAKLNKQRWEEERKKELKKEYELEPVEVKPIGVQAKLIKQQQEEEIERKRKVEEEVAQAKLIKQQREEAERRQKEQERLLKMKKELDLQMAQNYEVALRYDDAILIYEKYGQWEDAGRVRRLQQGKPVETVIEY